MKTLLMLLPAILSSVLLGAHFLRLWDFVLVLLCVWLPALLLIRRSWAARVIQVEMVAAALFWGRFTYVMAQTRQEEGEPWVRLVVILGSVAVLALVAAGLFETTRLRRRYGLRTGDWFKA